jgi:hypothetical protein
VQVRQRRLLTQIRVWSTAPGDRQTRQRKKCEQELSPRDCLAGHAFDRQSQPRVGIGPCSPTCRSFEESHVIELGHMRELSLQGESCREGSYPSLNGYRMAGAHFRLGRLCDAQFGQPTSDCATRNAGGAHDRADPATPRRPASAAARRRRPALVQHRSERLKALAYGQFVNHTKTM